MATRGLVPRADAEGSIGRAAKRWATGWINALIVTTLNALTLTAQAVGFTIAGGTTSKTLTVDETVTLSAKANLASPTFTGTPAAPAPADNVATTQLATTAFAKSQDAVLHRDPDQGVALTAAASGSSGITVADDDDIDFGTRNFTLVWRGSLPDWTPSSTIYIMAKSNTGSPYAGYYFLIETDGSARLSINMAVGGGKTWTAPVNTFVDNSVHEIVVSVNRADYVRFFYDGVQAGSDIAIETGTGDITNTANLKLLGLSAVRYASTSSFAVAYNRALTAAEVLDLYRNGIAESDKWGSQTEQTSGALVVGKRYRINNWITNDDFTNVGGANVDGTEFTATGTTPTTWTNSSTVVEIGATLALEPEGIQPSPGQWLDSSSNKLHAMQPATGSSLTRRMKTFEVRWTNTWAGTHEAQYIGGVNQAVLPPGSIRIESITMVVTGATGNVVLGDGSDADHFVASVALAAYLDCTVASRSHDGTNMKLVIDPDTNLTGSISTTVKGAILQ